MIKHARAIRNGRLENGEVFCWKGEIYPYTNDGYGKYPIHMENLVSKDHKMGYTFFASYFIDVIDSEFLKDEDFEI